MILVFRPMFLCSRNSCGAIHFHRWPCILCKVTVGCVCFQSTNRKSVLVIDLDIYWGQCYYCTGCHGFFSHLFDWSMLQQNLAIASFTNFMCLFSNSRRSADSINRWHLWMTLARDLDLIVLLHFEPFSRALRTCRGKYLQICTQAHLAYSHSSDVKISLAFFPNFIYWYIMFSTISQKRFFGHNFCTKAARMIILESKTMLLGSRNWMALFILSCTWPCLISDLWKAWN